MDRNDKSRDGERQKLINQITEWNANRLDLFELSLPDETVEFHGVMRFFYQDDGSKVATKCIRVASSASTQVVLETLVEKFRPDMRMLSLPTYALYEVHVNGEERKLQLNERPLFVQLNWGKDDREGRFLLKREDVKSALLPGMPSNNQTQQDVPPPMKRKLSKREKKELKKKEKEAKLKGKENESPEGVAAKLYNDLPDTSFTRTISNPEVVMRRRRQQKLEKKLQDIRSKDDQGGTLKIYGESIHPDVPYKTLLLSAQDPAWFVVKETLDKYGMEKENPDNFCLIQVMIPPEGSDYQNSSLVLDDEDCPLDILMHHLPQHGTIMFQLRRRTADMPPPKHRKKKKGRDPQEGAAPAYDQTGYAPDRLPYLVEINPDGSEPYKALRHALPPNVTEVGSDKNIPSGAQFIRLPGPDIQPRHCVLTHYEGVVTVTPSNPGCITYINNHQIMETTMLQHGMVLRFGKMHMFRFHNPAPAETRGAPPQQQMNESMQSRGPPSHRDDPSNFETTFDTDGGIQTRHDLHGQPPPQQKAMPQRKPDPQFEPPPQDEGLLPAALEFWDDAEEPFLNAIVRDVNGAQVQFKLAPTYSLYMATRYRLSSLYRPEMPPNERTHRVTGFINRIAHMVQMSIQDNADNAGGLSFWMANASELLHFFKVDQDISRFSQDAQDVLAEAVQEAFSRLVVCMQEELRNVMPGMLNPTRDDLEDSEVLQVLSSAMSLLRKCRVNAALTIQIFSQLFHYISMWLFNELILVPQAQLCTRQWGFRLKRRLAKVEVWAEKQGLELAADCHLARIIQAAHLLEAPKAGPEDIASISSACFKLNSLQLQALLNNYVPAPGEPPVPPELISNIVAVARNTADELTRSDGREVQLLEDADLQLPFLLPEDGYSCEIVKGIPNGLTDFIDPLAGRGMCRMSILQKASGMWTVYMMEPGMEGQEPQPEQQQQQPPHEPSTPGMPRDVETVFVSFPKVNGSMGLSIVAAKGAGQAEKGIYIKSLVPGGAAALDGRLQAGDQLIEVDGKSLIGLSQERAAEHMKMTGHTITLKVIKQGAIYHGLATLLSQPSPTMPRSSPTGGPPMPHGKQQRPMSEDVSRFGGPPRPGQEDPMMQKPINMQHGAQSSPALAPGRGQEPPFSGRQEPSPRPPGPPGQPPYNRPQDVHSKSTSHLEQAGGDQWKYGGPGSASTLPGRGHQQQQQQGHPLAQNQFLSQPELNRPRPDDNPDYENYPGGPPPPGMQGPGKPPRDPRLMGPPQSDYVNQQELKQQPPYGGKPGEVRPSQSMGNMHTQPPPQNLQRPQSDESLDQRRVQEWQQRNERDLQRERDVPRSTANNQQFQPGFYQGTQPHDAPPPFNRMQGPSPPGGMDPRSKPPGPAQQQPAQKPPVMQQEVPYMDMQERNRQQQQHFYDPQQRQQQQSPHSPPPSSQPYNQQHGPPPTSQFGPQYGQQPPTSQGYGGPPPTSQYGPPPTSQYGPPPTSQPNFPPSSQAYPPNTQPYQTPQQHPGQGPFQGEKQESPELPPPPPSDVPPEVPPPPQDPYGQEELPPPPPPPATSYEHLGPHSQQPNYSNYQNLVGQERHPPEPRMEPQRPPEPQQPSYGGDSGYPYQPRPAAAATQPPPASINSTRPNDTFNPSMSSQRPNDSLNQSRQQPNKGPDYNSMGRPGPPKQQQEPNRRPAPPGKKPPPPINPKPKLIAQEIAALKKQASSPSPWEREEKEREIKQREDELRSYRGSEIADLESRQPYLSPEEQERMKRLRLDQEFERRMAEQKGEEDEDDDDMTESAAGRARMLRLMQQDAEKKRRESERERQEREMIRDLGEFEKIQRNERKLQQFEQERMEQKERQLRRQEKRAQETEMLLAKQRERKGEREGDMGSSGGAPPLSKQQFMDRVAKREAQLKGDNGKPAVPPGARGFEPPRSTPPPNHQTSHPSYNKSGPPPPERKSSYDIYNKTGSGSNLSSAAAGLYDGQNTSKFPGVPNAGRPYTQPIQQQPPPMDQDQYTPSKKSVSFHQDPVTEVRVQRRFTESVSSDSSFQPQSPGTPQQDTPFQNYMGNNTGPPPPTSQYNQQFNPAANVAGANNNNNYANQRTPDPAPGQQPPNFVTGDTPGVVGAQEVYRDPRDRMLAAKRGTTPPSSAERMSFRDKMKMFATEIGENTPPDKSKSSLMQQRIEAQLKSP